MKWFWYMYFIGDCIINRKLHGRLEIRNCQREISYLRVAIKHPLHTWSSPSSFFFLISSSTNSREVTHFCLTGNEGASRYRFCTGQHLCRDSTLSIYGRSEGAVPISSDDMTAEWTVTWPSLPHKCSTSDGEDFSEIKQLTTTRR